MKKLRKLIDVFITIITIPFYVIVGIGLVFIALLELMKKENQIILQVLKQTKFK